MKSFDYMDRGKGPMLVYHLAKDESLESPINGRFSNMKGILYPSVRQENGDIFLEYGIASKIPLAELMRREMDRRTILHLCLSAAEIFCNGEEVMLSQSKLILDTQYIFVNSGCEEAALVYLPVQEYHQEMDLKEFILYFISHIRFQTGEDTSYVVKILQFLNGASFQGSGQISYFLRQLLQESSSPAPEKKKKGLFGRFGKSKHSEASEEGEIFINIDQETGEIVRNAMAFQETSGTSSGRFPFSQRRTHEPKLERTVLMGTDKTQILPKDSYEATMILKPEDLQEETEDKTE